MQSTPRRRKTGLASLLDVLAGEPPHVRCARDREEDLGRDDRPRPARCELAKQPAGDLLARAERVHVRRVEEVDTGLDRASERTVARPLRPTPMGANPGCHSSCSPGRIRDTRTPVEPSCMYCIAASIQTRFRSCDSDSRLSRAASSIRRDRRGTSFGRGVSCVTQVQPATCSSPEKSSILGRSWDVPPDMRTCRSTVDACRNGSA